MIQHVFISHLHPDHVSDLAALIQAKVVLTYLVKMEEHVVRLQIYVGEKIYEETKTLLSILAYDLSDFYELICVRGGDIYFAGDFEFSIMKVMHGNADAYASRWITKDRKMCVYTGDSTYMEQLVHFSHGNDLLLCDSSRGVSHIADTRHMSAYEAGILAQKSASKHLVLLHNYPGTSESDLRTAASQNFKGTVSLGELADNLQT
jgi:ribonuclease BN (tRNA processing enzyme)